MITGIGTPNSQSKIPLPIVTLLNTAALRLQSVISPDRSPVVGNFPAERIVDVSAVETSMSLDLLTQYLDHALTFERMAEDETNGGLKADFERQANAYRRLAAQRARRLGLPLPSEPNRRTCESV
jgi:hypothetical protein